MKELITTAFARDGGWRASARRVRVAMTLLLVLSNSMTAWAGIDPFKEVGYKTGWYYANAWNSLSYNQCNGLDWNSTNVGWWSGYGYSGTTVTGDSRKESSKVVVWSLYKHVKNIPSHTRIRLNCTFSLGSSSTALKQAVALYARNDLEKLKDTGVDCTESYTNESGKEYHIAHLKIDWGTDWSGSSSRSFDFDNRNSSSANDKTWALLLTQVIGNSNGADKYVGNWVGFKVIGVSWSYYYYKHITFDANGGSGSMSQQDIENSGSLNACSMTRNGYVFAGWNTKADGSGTYYADKASITATSSDKGNVKLYAQWLSTADNLNGVFNQEDRKVRLTWDIRSGSSPRNGTFVIYRNNTKIGTVARSFDANEAKNLTFEDTNTATQTHFPYESNVNYDVYLVPAGWDVNTKRSDMKTSVTVNTSRTVPVNNLTAVSSDDRVTLTWTSVSFSASSNMNNKFDIYANGVKYATITPSENQTTFTWEHRDNNALAGKDPVHHEGYTEEDLDACTMFNYRVVGQIDGKELNSVEECNKAIGAGTTYENFTASKGDNQGSVLLTWNVKHLAGQSSAETYVIERRVVTQEEDEDAWQKLTTLDSDKTFMTWEDKTPLPGVFYEYRITCYNYCENGNRPRTTAYDTGFAMSSGVVSGRITYGTGTAVSDVKVTLRQNNEDGEAVSHLHSLLFTGAGTGMVCNTTNKDLKKLLGGDFTIQAYVNPNNSKMNADGTAYMLFDASGVFSILLKYDSSQNAYQLGAYINGNSHFTDQYISANKWSHLSCVYRKSAQTTTFYVTTDADHIATGTIDSQSIDGIGSELTKLALANSTTLDNANNFGGYLDEFRFFKRALAQTEIAKNYNHPMGGTETDLAIYYPMDENMGTQNIVYDFSKSNNKSNGHHATAEVPALSSDYVPTEEQLSLMALTDGQGNYVVRGVPFSGEGTNYTIIPTLGIHEFSPAYLSRYVSASSLVHSGVDFEDVSSFPVSGTVYYANTDYPVEDCYIYVDGQMCARNGEPITTDPNGEFTVSVPIGDHYIQIVKNGHTFTSEGRYPADPNDLGQTHTFDQKITGLEFTDETLVNFTGRVVGGSIEGEKPVGFGLSQNNIGVVELTLSPQNENYRMNVVKNVTETSSSLETNVEQLPVASATESIKSTSWRGATADCCKKIYIRTDPATGEFSAMLPPLQYKVESMKVVKSNQNVGEATTIDLTNSQRTQTDSVRTEAGELQEYEYNTMLRQVYHSTPSFSVTQRGSEDGHFGIEKYKITDDLGDIEINDLYSVDDTTGDVTYNYGGAVFVKDDPYTFLLSGYEEYTNSDAETPVISRVPLSGIVVTINNALSDGQSVYAEGGEVDGKTVKAGEVVELQSNQMALDDEGCGTYTWCAGLPNISEPYTRTISMSYDIDGRTYQWSGNGMTGVILGEMPTGNNFVTAGPDQLLMVLRDPPGSESSAEWSTGSSTTTSTTKGNTFSESFQATNTFKFGYKEGIITGTPAVGTISTVDSDNDLTAGVVQESEGENSHSNSITTSVTKAVATKGMGDVFIGNATNIIFGKARMLNFKRTSGNNVELGLNDIMTTGLRFGTAFNYSLTYIEETLLPNWEKMRNQFLTHVENQAVIDGYVNNSDHSVYLTTLTEDDEDFGKTGTYTQFAPANMGADEVAVDSVRWVNTQVDNWIKYLAFNEQEKVLAFEKRGDNVENYSFDSGADVNWSVETETSHVSSWEWTVSAGAIVGDNFGFEVKGLGFEINIEAQAMGGRHEATETEVTNTSSFSYTLSEDGDYDALSVDVYHYGAFSPIFRTRGGQTSNPYEGEVRTTYYEDENGNHPVIMEATMQIEVPQIDVDVPVVSDIPSGTAANYILKLGNASEIGADVAYRIMLLDETNANGAQLTMDGMPLTGEGRLIKVPGNQTLTKALQLRQTDTGVLDYENIGIVFASSSEPEEIADTVYITAYFTPSSSSVDLTLNNSIMNTQTGTDLKLTFKNFDRNYKNQNAFRLQYKKQGSTDWTLLHEYVLNQTQVTENNELLPEGANIDYILPMNQFTDGDYLFRVLSVATYGTGEVYRSSEELSLVKDMQRPRPLGQPEPADGILSVGDELSVTFNETILKGELTQTANFKVTGVLNGAEVAHETALSMQNTEATAQTEANIQLAGKDFSIDTWLNLNGGEGTLFSHGTAGEKLNVGTDAQNHLVVIIGSETYTSDNVIPTGAWVFLTLSLTQDGKLSATVASDASETQLFNAQDAVAYEGNGPLTVGKHIEGAIHELLLWDEAHDMTEALLQRSRTKNPATRHLIGYWKMDEGEGKTIRDYARNRHMTMSNETWYMNNVNKAVSLTEGRYLSVDASALPTYSEDDYALEFWMRGDTQGAAQLLQMGQVGLWLDGNGELQLTGKGAYLDIEAQSSLATNSGKLTDNAWHHIALNVLRQGAAAVYVDGVRRLTTNAANVGGIATNNLLMGAHRKTLSEHGEYSYDRTFTGQIDELRIWNATLNADKLLSNRKVRLTGSEDGLVAYYPFETKQLDQYSQVETVGTAADLCGSGKQATMSNGEVAYTETAPALRTKQTETNVPFTFVASNEKIVISIDEDPAIIEGCTLNFTVRDVRDENGNYSAPAVWSAFVNLNQLVWSENSLSVEKQQTATTTVTTTVVNNSGQQKMWTLSGMPAWLEASIVDGETNPLTETKVDFTILPSAPLGRSEVTVYLRGNDKIDVPLTLNIKVMGNVPDWAVNPHDFETSMNVIAVLKKDGTPMTDTDDIMAAFVGEECRGVAHPEYNERYGNYYVTMDIYGASTEAGQEVTFRAYDASTGTVYPVVTLESGKSFKFIPLKLQGSYAEPKVFNIQNLIEQEMELKTGWNWISFNVVADDMTVPALFEKIADDVVIVKNQTSSLTPENGSWGGDLTDNLSNAEMYAVQMKADRKLRIVGTSVNTPVFIQTGWNWLGYYGRQVASLGDALADMQKENSDMLKAQRGVAYWDVNSWSGSLMMMEPGKGYQLKSNADNQTFSYPSAAVAGARCFIDVTTPLSSGEGAGVRLFSPVNFRNYPDNAIMAVKVVADSRTLTGVEVAAFVGDECRTATFTNEEGIAFLTIPGDETCGLTFKVAVAGEVVDAPLTFTYETDAIYGTPKHPVVMNLGDINGIREMLNDNGIGSIYDLSGRKIRLDDQTRKLQKGVYIINGQKKTVK